MRNNPKHGTKLEYEDMFVEYAKTEKLRRFFQFRRQKIFKHFSIRDYNANFLRKHVDEYLKDLDDELGMDGKLNKHFNTKEHFKDFQPDDLVGFDNFYDRLSQWGIEQKTLSYDDFATEEVPAPKLA